MAKKKAGGGTTRAQGRASKKKKSAKKTSAKNGKTADGQALIDGTFDPVPEDVQEKVDHYVVVLAERQQAQKQEDLLRSEAIALMKENSIERVELDSDRYLVLEHAESDKLKVKKKKDLED